MFNMILMVLILLVTFVIGYHLISRIPALLHTPLMSMTNAVSGITILAAVLVFSHKTEGLLTLMGFVAVILATVNVVGGFTITDRMLKMFKKREGQGSQADNVTP